MPDVYIVKIDKDLSNNDFIYLINRIPEEEKERICKFRRFEDSQRSLLGSVLSRFAISKRTGLNFNCILYEKNKYGKPFLANTNAAHFNISHSGNWVVCVVDDEPVGIDVEIIRLIDINIAERFFSKDEHNMLLNETDEERQNIFYKIWTVKESYIKAEGKGLSIPLNSFSSEFKDSVIRVKAEDNYSPYSFHQYWLDKISIVSVCSTSFSTPNLYKMYSSSFIQNVISLNT
jgi:4'-phosphopantetheinyl transferase